MLVFLIKASVVIASTWLFYKIFLQKESFFAVNRFFLLASLFLAFMIPFLNIPELIDHQGLFNDFLARIGLVDESAVNPSVSHSLALGTPESIQIEGKSKILETVESQKSINGFTILMIGYLLGVLILGIHFLYQLISLFLYVKRAQDKQYNLETVIIHTDKNLAPCSFFNYIFINPADYKEDIYKQILAHEKIHAQYGHSYDLILAKLATIILWFNPFIWLFRRELEQNIEYQTDHILLTDENQSMEAYQMSLLQVAAPGKNMGLTTNYNQSLLTQRIIMMKSQKSTPRSLWKYTLLGPLFLGILLVLNAPAVAQQQNSSDKQENVQKEDRKIKKPLTPKTPKKSVEMAYQNLYLVINADTKEDLLDDIKTLLKEYEVDFNVKGIRTKNGKIYAIEAEMDFANGSAGGLSFHDLNAPIKGSGMFYYENETGVSGSGGGYRDNISDYGKNIMNNNLNGLFLLDKEGKMHVRGYVELP